ncbi:DUF4124 domain-containing protein [Pseudomonas sp. nanlin1]|uniref:DUF4124 domain-containing protein n=1 Tax=Pseudomonas sp. nanlin1 TaxID=3040605 RepID=UPI00389011B7
MLFAAGPVLAAETSPGVVLYRYTDSRGVTVLDRQGVPPEFVGKGYQVLNQQGRVIRVVAPAPTADELARKQEQQAKAEAQAQLLAQYPSLADLDAAKARALADYDLLAAQARSNIQALLAQQGAVQSQAADQERSGQPVSQDLLERLDDLRRQRTDLQVRIAAYQTARAQAEQDFALRRAQLEQLLAR